MSSVHGHGCRYMGGRERLVGLLLEALGPQVQQWVEGRRWGRRRCSDPSHRGEGIIVWVRGEEGLGGVAVRQRGQREQCYRGRRVQAGKRGVVVSGERQREVSAGWRGAATETSGPLEEAILLLTLLLSEVLLILKHLKRTQKRAELYSHSEKTHTIHISLTIQLLQCDLQRTTFWPTVFASLKLS